MTAPRKHQQRNSTPDVRNQEKRRLIFKEFIACRMKVIVERMTNSLADLHERFDLSTPQWMMLAALAQHTDASSTEIKNRTAMDKSRVNRAAGSLLARQLVLQRMNSDDNRAHKMRLTVKGQQVYARVEALALGWGDELLQGVSAEDLECFNRVLEQFENNLNGIELRQAQERSTRT
jgi:DNA-binding MarR family transcriptional regulator